MRVLSYARMLAQIKERTRVVSRGKSSFHVDADGPQKNSGRTLSRKLSRKMSSNTPAFNKKVHCHASVSSRGMCLLQMY